MQLLRKSEQHLEALDRLTNTVEFALVEKQVFAGLQQGNKVLQELNKEMSLQHIEDIMDAHADAIEHQNQVSSLLASGVADEVELEAELAMLEDLPNVPSREPLESSPIGTDEHQRQPEVPLAA